MYTRTKNRSKSGKKPLKETNLNLILLNWICLEKDESALNDDDDDDEKEDVENE